MLMNYSRTLGIFGVVLFGLLSSPAWAATSASADVPPPKKGCGCHVVGSSNSSVISPAWLIALGALVLRRKSSNPSS
jgi:MYXO-CTERM domain-containing protein